MSGPTWSPAGDGEAADAGRRCQNAGKASRLPPRNRSRRFRRAKEVKRFFIASSRMRALSYHTGAWYMINSQQIQLVKGEGVVNAPFHTLHHRGFRGLR